MAAFFAVRDAISQIRSPFSYVGEGTSRKKSADESEAEPKLMDQGFVVTERYQKHEATFIEFSKLKYRFMAVFGPEAGKNFYQVTRNLNSIFIAAQMLSSHYWRQQGRIEMNADQFKIHIDEMHRPERVFWDHQDDADEIRASLKKTEAEFTKIIAPVIQEYMKAISSRWTQFRFK